MTAPRRLPVLSASQVATFEACPRKWAYGKLDGVEAPAHPSAQFGTQVHAHLEAWFESRTLPPDTDTGKVARAMLPHLPAPQAIRPENVEAEFAWRFDDEVAFRGFIDLVDESTVPLTIYDHKTTSSLAYAKTVDDLLNDPQATLYARALMDSRGLDAVRLRWTYATRKGRTEVLPVEVVVTRDDIDLRLRRTIQSAREMLRFHEERASAAEVPANYNACTDFGGCFFRDRCPTATPTQTRTDMTDSKNSFLQRLQARKAGATTAAPAPTPAPTPVVVAPMAVNPPEADIPPPAPAPAPVEAAPAKRGPGRPRKNEAAPVAAPAPAPAPAPVVEEIEAAPATPASVAPTSIAPVPVSGWTLYLDCAPVKGAAGVEYLADRLARVLADYVAETGHHYRLTEYGKGPALFAEGFARSLAENPPRVGIVASTASQETRDVLQALTAAAAIVVQG